MATAEGATSPISHSTRSNGRDFDQVWDASVSGMIFKKLQDIAQRWGRTTRIYVKGSPVEVFEFNGETALLYNPLRNGTTGEVGGYIVPRIESHQYKRLPWWREAIDGVGTTVELLDVPLVWAGKDAKIPHYENLLRPSRILQRLGLPESRLDTIYEAMKAVLEPVVSPDYTIVNDSGILRLGAVSQDAIQSRLKDNQVYQRATEAIAAKAEELERALQKLTNPPLH